MFVMVLKNLGVPYSLPLRGEGIGKLIFAYNTGIENQTREQVGMRKKLFFFLNVPIMILFSDL